jgi:hypothetical protein
MMQEAASGRRSRPGEPAGLPRLADGVELLGEFKDSRGTSVSWARVLQRFFSGSVSDPAGHHSWSG